MVFVYIVKNATLVKKPKTAVENTQNNAFVIFVFFKGNIMSMWQRTTLLDIKKSVYKSFILSIKKYLQSLI